MIGKEKILKLFKNFVGETIDLHGLKCVPISLGELKKHNWDPNPDTTIIFNIENPNDTPYYYSIVEDELLIIAQEFSDYINTKLKVEVLWKGKPKLYLNGEVKGQIQKVFDSVREINFSTGSFLEGYSKWTIQIESVKFLPGYFDEDSYHIKNVVVPLSATKNGENVKVYEAVDEYVNEYLSKQETYYETEKYYQGIDQILNLYPLLTEDYIATYYETKFIV